MSEAPLMVGVSGLRGIVGKSLTPEVAARFAGAFGGWVRERATKQSGRAAKKRPILVLATDGRAGCAPIVDAAAAGLMASGCDVVELRVAMTPTVGVAVDALGAMGAVQVTASHNPQEWCGMKLLVRDPRSRAGQVDACAPDVKLANQVIARFGKGEVANVPWNDVGDRTTEDLTEAHWALVTDAVGGPGIRAIKRKKFRTVLDSVGGAGGVSSHLFLEWEFGCTDEKMGVYKDGRFTHPPEPLREHLGELCRAVKRHKAAVGFAQDPDADRLAVVDERGRYIGEEYTLVLAAEALLGANSAGKTRSSGRKRPVLVTNLSTSRMIDDVAARHGAKVIRTAVGEANGVEAMKREKAAGAFVALGGEGNGGVIWPAVTYVRDSLSAMALVLMLMARTGKTMSELVAGMPRYAIEKRKVDLAQKEDAAPAVDKIAAHWKQHQVDRQDGVRVDFSSGALAGKAWIHVRASNTEPIMRLIAEAPEVGQARAILDEAAGVIGR